jgi:hypothetical protein
MNDSKKASELKDLNNLIADSDSGSGKRLDKTLKILDQIKNIWAEVSEEKKGLKLRIEDKFKEIKFQNDAIDKQFAQGKVKLSKLVNDAEEELKKINILENKVILLLDY